MSIDMINNLLQYLKRYWYYLVILLMLVALIKLMKPPVLPPDDSTVIEQLRDSVNNLNNKTIELQEAYDNKQTVIIENVIKQNKQNAKDITNISNLTYVERNDLWAEHSAKKDSVPQRYWDILHERSGGRTSEEIKVQRRVQK